MSNLKHNSADQPIRNRSGLTLGEYVQRRNGVPLGAPGSLQNMLYRSFGAGTFAEFWRYWNPIWGYALGRYIYAPLQKFFPVMLALVLTFTISGVIHDLATTLVRGSIAFLFTPWFTLMGIAVVIERALHIDYSKQAWSIRMMINLGYILGSLAFTLLIIQLFP